MYSESSLFGRAIVSVGATVQATAPVSVTAVTEPEEIVDVAIGRTYGAFTYVVPPVPTVANVPSKLDVAVACTPFETVLSWQIEPLDAFLLVVVSIQTFAIHFVMPHSVTIL
jgi:hypothetical protein